MAVIEGSHRNGFLSGAPLHHHVSGITVALLKQKYCKSTVEFQHPGKAFERPQMMRYCPTGSISTFPHSETVKKGVCELDKPDEPISLALNNGI